MVECWGLVGSVGEKVGEGEGPGSEAGLVRVSGESG